MNLLKASQRGSDRGHSFVSIGVAEYIEKERVIFTTNTRVTACRGQSSTCSKERKSFLRILFARHKEKPLSQMLLYYTQDNNTILLPLLRIVAQPKKPQEVWNERTIPMPLLVLAVIQPCV